MFFSLTTSNVYLKLWRSSKDHWWKTYASIFFCLMVLQGKPEGYQIYWELLCYFYD